MIETITLRKQTPTDPSGWLYEDANDTRTFKKMVYLGANAEPWSECTDGEKIQWEEAHKVEEPEINP